MTEYLVFAKKLAHEAGNIMRQHFGTDEVELKDDQSPVTVADTEINDLVIERVTNIFPSHSVRGEEKRTNKVGDEYVWVVDPIDGTHYFEYGIALAMVSIVLVKNGQPIVAVVYEPMTDSMFYASKGGGAFRNGKKLNVNDQSLVKGTRIDVCDIKDHPVGELRKVRDAIYDKCGKAIGIRTSVAVGCLVAQGSFAAAITPAHEPHDIAAAKLLVEEAGGVVTDIHGNEQRYDDYIKGAIISNKNIYEDLLEIVKENT